MNNRRVIHITTVDMSLRMLLFNQMKSLQAAGYEIVTISSPGPYVDELEAAGFKHIAIPITRKISPLHDLLVLWRLVRVMRRLRPAIVHTHTPKPGLLGQLAARIAGVPVIVNTLHGFYFHEHMPRLKRQFYVEMERIAGRCSHLILSQNQEDIRTAIDEGISPPHKIRLLGNGIDLTDFAPECVPDEAVRRDRESLGIMPGGPVVGFVGRLAAKRKGFTDFLAAAQQIVAQNPATHFLIVGDADPGKPDSVSPDVAHDYGIADHCLFMGWQPNAKLPLFYRLMDVIVLPSLFEGVPRALMEAAAMGVPAVATDVKGNREAINNGENGLLVPLGDVDALAKAILQILESPELAQQMGAAGCELARTRFDERIVFERVKATYAELLGDTVQYADTSQEKLL